MISASEVALFQKSLLARDRATAWDIVQRCLKDFAHPHQLLEQLIVPSLEALGNAWHVGEIALAQVYLGGRICEDLVEELLPAEKFERINRPRMAIATLEDFHLLGKQMVFSTIRASGYQLLDYKRSRVKEIAERAIDDGIQILFISTLMLPSALRIREVRERLDEAGFPVKLVVGGAPFRFDDQLWREVKADAAGRTADEAVQIIKRFEGEFS